MEVIIRHLESCCGAKDKLITKFNIARWLSISEDPGTKTIVKQALLRIADSDAQYGLFMSMLKGIEGMDIVVTKIEGKSYISS